MNIVEGANTNQTASTFNLAGQTILQIAYDFNGVNYDTSSVSGYQNLSNLGITAYTNASATAVISNAMYGQEQGAIESAQSRLSAAVESARVKLAEFAASAGEGASDFVKQASEGVEDFASSVSSMVSSPTASSKDEL